MLSGHKARAAREAAGMSRERVVAQLTPPCSTKTLERYEKEERPIPRWRGKQLALLYGVTLKSLEAEAVTA